MTQNININYRLIRYNAAKQKNEVLLQNLAFANGIILSDDESFVLVAETLACHIIKYHLKGPKAGQKEIFIDGLPGLPDNLQSDGQGGFIVTTIITADSEHPLLSLVLTPHPYLRKMLVRLLLMMELPFKLLHDIYPSTFTEKVLHGVGSYHVLGDIFNTLKKSFVLRIDASGNIIEILFSEDNTINSISEAFIHNGFVWFGSPWRNYLARLPLKQVFPDLANNEKQSSRTRSENAAASNVKSERAKRDTISTSASTTTSKPTPTSTTTPKPIATPTTSKPTTTPKPFTSPTLKVDKPTTTDNSNEKPSKIKNPTSKSASDAKVKENSAETVKVEQDASIREKVQKSFPKKVKPVEANRPRDDL